MNTLVLKKRRSGCFGEKTAQKNLIPAKGRDTRVTTQIHPGVAAGTSSGTPEIFLDTIALYREHPGCFMIRQTLLGGHLPQIPSCSLSPDGSSLCRFLLRTLLFIAFVKLQLL